MLNPVTYTVDHHVWINREDLFIIIIICDCFDFQKNTIQTSTIYYIINQNKLINRLEDV